MPKYFPGRVAIATSKEIFAPILWLVSHSRNFLCGLLLADMQSPGTEVRFPLQMRPQCSSSRCTHLYGVISRRSVNLIIRTGGL